MNTYSFLSYSHKDWNQIEPYYKALEQKGHDIWYDARIIPASEWVEMIASKLKGAASCLLFLSPDAIASPNVRREIHYAIANHIPTIAVVIRPCELSEGLKLELSECSFIYTNVFDTFADCIDEIQLCIDEKEADGTRRDSVREGQHKKGIQNAGCVLAGMILGALCLWFFLMGFERTNTNKGSADYARAASAFAEELYKIVERGGKDNYQLLWDAYVSDTTKRSGIITEEEWLKLNMDKVAEHDYHILSYEVVRTETLPNDAFVIRSRIHFRADGKEYSEENREYLIVEDGSFKYLLDGILETQNYQGGETDKKGIFINDIKMTRYANRMLFKMNIENHSGHSITIGEDEFPRVVVIDTTEGTYMGKLEEKKTIGNGYAISLETQIYLGAGEPEKILLNHITDDISDRVYVASLTLT